MWNTFSHSYMAGGSGFGFGVGGYNQGFFGFLAIVMIWSLVWKAFALWKAARRGDSVWFAVLLVLNTVGIAEILYLFVFSEPKGILKDKTNTVVSKNIENKGKTHPQA
ncbi:MAG: hypothetical protein CO029_05000 [Candidatus Magasanikbacteria bacterium CG_4_9_14_0_2_um_filter_41_10]|uniref:DUF5652 domain-containing protein n=1 Tax=Candidatus Magasanikbacteria bacterium CG_4_10_14_0_2_um_filter_41_31 TaxID=1974639 RepID=A0A2M7V5Q3_9BACT|nr:MAG: hypothetical protein COX83_00615 [Candidatus Magasanikbacteria bacterium CG_4_10_14_0_2_um_filter_41_31]PJC53031.1 MAG: hypothetical protein CO029_05000 [Candidatus Magasanikbacteria bacterium CG_4_9_14_0_2_um_filter_41_10]